MNRRRSLPCSSPHRCTQACHSRHQCTCYTSWGDPPSLRRSTVRSRCRRSPHQEDSRLQRNIQGPHTRGGNPALHTRNRFPSSNWSCRGSFRQGHIQGPGSTRQFHTAPRCNLLQCSRNQLPGRRLRHHRTPHPRSSRLPRIPRAHSRRPRKCCKNRLCSMHQGRHTRHRPCNPLPGSSHRPRIPKDYSRRRHSCYNPDQRNNPRKDPCMCHRGCSPIPCSIHRPGTHAEHSPRRSTSCNLVQYSSSPKPRTHHHHSPDPCSNPDPRNLGSGSPDPCTRCSPVPRSSSHREDNPHLHRNPRQCSTLRCTMGGCNHPQHNHCIPPQHSNFHLPGSCPPDNQDQYNKQGPDNLAHRSHHQYTQRIPGLGSNFPLRHTCLRSNLVQSSCLPDQQERFRSTPTRTQ
mmetsp:Transcript_50958/g.103597  ORF Transcript_50958/g.103597 Transcript_50958/m.103597 type:complete len:402 (+) Transcript_50958:3515-4720(+)